MAIEADVRTLLLSLGSVTAMVGTGYSARIRPDRLQQDDDETQEHVIIEVDNEEHLNDLTGKGGRVMADITLRCRAKTKAEARSLAEAVKLNGTNPGTGMAGYSGTLDGKTVDFWLEDEQTVYEPVDDGSDEGVYAVYQSYRATWAANT